jgi:tetratricopeptide (TPR) repeat protein
MKKVPSDKDKKRFQQAMEALNNGRPKEAIRLFERVQKAGGNHPDIWYLLGLAHGKLGQMDKVRQVSLRCLEISPNHYGALCNLANTLMLFGDKEGALENYAKAMKAKPGDETVINNYGRALDLLGRREEAIKHFEEILEKNREYAPAYASLGKAYAAAGQPEKAIEKFNEALHLDSKSVEAHLGIGALYTGMGGMAMAERHLKAAVDAAPNNVDALIGLISASNLIGDFDKSISWLSKAEKITPNSTEILASKANILQRIGEFDDSYKILQRLKKENRVNALAMHVYSDLCRRFDNCDETIELIEKSLDAPQFNSSEKQMMRFDLGRLYDKLKRYDEAFDSYKKANETVSVTSKIESDRKYIDELVSHFSKDGLSLIPRADIDTKRPIFILGMPRSGTSLTEQILSGHPDIHGAGELADLKFVTKQIEASIKKPSDNYLEAFFDFKQADMNKYSQMYLDRLAKLDSEALHVTDKMPHNFLHIGVISTLFPEAKIIHCKRNPLDTALSIYFQNFSWTHDYAIELERIGNFYNLYNRLMKHWEEVIDTPIMTCQYEDMVDDKAGISKKLIEFCGLEWDEKILDFQDSKRAIATASYDQVRQPMYKTSRERWKNYEKHIGPLIDALDFEY